MEQKAEMGKPGIAIMLVMAESATCSGRGNTGRCARRHGSVVSVLRVTQSGPQPPGLLSPGIWDSDRGGPLGPLHALHGGDRDYELVRRGQLRVVLEA